MYIGYCKIVWNKEKYWSEDVKLQVSNKAIREIKGNVGQPGERTGKDGDDPRGIATAPIHKTPREID